MGGQKNADSEFKELVIYTGGFISYFFGGLIIFLSTIIIDVVSQFINREVSIDVFLLTLVMIGWLVIYIITYLRTNRIELTKDMLNTFFADREKMYRGSIFVPVKKETVNVEDIEKVVVAKGKHLKEIAQIVENKGATILAKLLLIKAFMYSPWIYVMKKDGQPLLIDTKHFSKKDCIKLLNAFRELGIPVEVQKGVI